MHYKNDAKDGEEIRYFANGKIEIRCNYKNGVYNGKFERFNTAGKPEEAGNFVDGEKDGKWVFYDERGNEGVVVQFKAGKMVAKQDNINNKKGKK